MRRSGARWCCECQKGCCLLEPDPRVMAARTLMAQQLVRAFGMQWSDVRAFYVRSLPTRKVGGWATTAAATKAGQAEYGPGAAGAFALDETCTVPFAYLEMRGEERADRLMARFVETARATAHGGVPFTPKTRKQRTKNKTAKAAA